MFCRVFYSQFVTETISVCFCISSSKSSVKVSISLFARFQKILLIGNPAIMSLHCHINSSIQIPVRKLQIHWVVYRLKSHTVILLRRRGRQWLFDMQFFNTFSVLLNMYLWVLFIGQYSKPPCGPNHSFSQGLFSQGLSTLESEHFPNLN